MAETTAAGAPDPLIEPSSFDLLISGTGLVESLIAAAASRSGKSVLHLDPNPNYGAHFSSLSPHSLSCFLQQIAAGAESPAQSNSPRLEPRQIYSDVEIAGEVPEPSRSFLVDVAGPRVLYCADPMVELMIRSGASHHVEFKSVDASLIYLDGKLQIVPDSREAIFKDKNLSLTEKTQMMRFLKLVRGHIGGDNDNEISEADLAIPFVKFLENQRLPTKIKLIVLYAIAMADYDQDNPENHEHLMNTRKGLESLSLYSSSIGRFQNASGALIYPIYGHGELPQAFCRLAAVKGALYVLRMPASSLLFDEEEKAYKGIRLATGQQIYGQRILMDPSFHDLRRMDDTINPCSGSKVARLACITKSSLYLDLSNILIVFPPKSLFPSQETSIRALQLGSNGAVCPPGFFVVYFSTKCKDAEQGKEHVIAAMNAIFKIHDDGNDKLAPLWSVSYVQELTQAVQGSSLSYSPMPDGNLDYQSVLKSTEELFHSMYPEEEFFPASNPSEGEEEEEEEISHS